MKFQELLAGKQINWDRVKLIRHNLTKEEIAANYERGYLELYQSVQNHARFRDCDMVISFWGRKARMVFSGLLLRWWFKAIYPHKIPRRLCTR